MKLTTLLLTLSILLVSTGAMAYSVHGNTEDGFVLKCNDDTEFWSAVPMNHNTAMEKCAGHGGIAAGYPRKQGSVTKATKAPISPSSSSTKAAPAQDYNSSRSNNES